MKNTPSKTALLKRMKDLDACEEATAWVKKQPGTAGQIWKSCERGHWMLWFAAKTCNPRDVGMAACLVARESLVYVPAGELRPLRCIETTEAYWRGEATIVDVREARSAAAAAAAYAAAAASDTYAADAAADAAAYAAANAANASYAASAASYAAANAANAAANAAYAAADAAYAAADAAYAAADARKKSLSRSAEIVRTIFPKVPR